MCFALHSKRVQLLSVNSKPIYSFEIILINIGLFTTYASLKFIWNMRSLVLKNIIL